MALIKWKAAVSGDWATATEWSTGTLPTAADDVAINLVGNYTVTVTNAQIANTLDFNAPGATLVQSATGKLTLNSFQIDNGLVELNGANTIGATTLNGGLLSLGKAGALGTGGLTLSGGELLSTVSQSLNNPLTFTSPGGFATVTIGAAHGKILNLNGSLGWTFGPQMAVQFGTQVGANDGVVIWHTPAGSSGAPAFVNVAAGMLKAGDSGFSSLLSTGDTTVGFFGTINLAGFSTTIANLSGSGKVANSGAAAILTVGGSDNGFSGRIVGALSLKVVTGSTTVQLTGANTYTGSTTITQGAALFLGNGGTTGSIAATSPIINDGQLVISRSNAVTLGNSMTGGGSLLQAGGGTTTINRANSYTGGTAIQAGILAAGNAGAFGTGAVTGGFNGNGALLGTINETLTNQIATLNGGSFTLAAAHLRTLALKSSLGWNLDQTVALNFGAPGQDGTVVWFTPAGSTGQAAAINVNAGTLKAGDANFSQLVQRIHSVVTVAAGARVDLAGFATTIGTLEGAGTVTSSSGSPTLALSDAAFAGAITGAISLDVQGDVQLSGANTYTGTTNIEGGAVLVLGNGGTTGSIGGNPILDNGTLVINRSNTLTLANAISGSGILDQIGTGTTAINVANSYNGGTFITGGGAGHRQRQCARHRRGHARRRRAGRNRQRDLAQPPDDEPLVHHRGGAWQDSCSR